MPVWPGGLDDRRLEPEIMDQPELDQARLHHALRGLMRLNRWSRSVRILWPAIAAYAREHHLHRLNILDIASGAGDLAIGLWLQGRSAGIDLVIEGWDINPETIAFAREQAARRQAGVEFLQRDAFEERLPADCDVVVSSLFLHHLDQRRAVMLLGRMGRATRGLVLINDLRRSRAGLGLAHAAARLLTTSEVVRNDAPASVRSAFTIAEVRDLARRAGLEGAEVSRRWPFRFLLKWMKP